MAAIEDEVQQRFTQSSTGASKQEAELSDSPEVLLQYCSRPLLTTDALCSERIKGRERWDWVRSLTFDASYFGRWASTTPIHEIHYDTRAFDPKSYLFGRYQKEEVTVGQDGKITIGFRITNHRADVTNGWFSINYRR